MKRLLVYLQLALQLALLLAWSATLHAADTVNPGIVPIKVEEVTPSRILPHAFFDQAISSIQVVYPESEILDGVRFRQLGSIAYAYVAYRTDRNAARVRLEMMATHDRRAWHLAAEPVLAALDAQCEAFLREIQRLSDDQSPSTRQEK